MARVDAWLRLARFALERVKALDDGPAADHADVALHRVKKALERKPRPRPTRGQNPVSSAGSCYRCTCGYELAGAELAAFLETCGSSTPVTIGCKNCGGVAVRMTGGNA